MNSSQTREQYLDFNIKLIEQLLNVQFDGQTLEEKEAFYSQYKEASELLTQDMLSAMYEVHSGAVKVYQLNDCDWVAAKSLEEAIAWYKENIVDDDDYIYDESEVEDLSTFMITFEKMEEDHEDYAVYGHLQSKYLKEEEAETYKVPAIDVLFQDWLGTPFIFCSKEP